MKYIVYTRQSKPSRKSRLVPLSHDMQRQKCLDVLPSDTDKVFFMDPSGADNNILKRKVFLEALDKINRKDVFVVYSLDRLCRDFYQMGYIKTTIEQKGAYLISATEKDIDRTMMGFTAVMADSQKQQIRSRTKDALQRLKALGYRVGRIPYGYSLGEDQKVVSNREEQSILLKMEHLVEEGECLREIAQRLHREGIRNRVGKPFSHVSIHKILKNAQSHREAYSEIPQPHQCI